MINLTREMLLDKAVAQMKVDNSFSTTRRLSYLVEDIVGINAWWPKGLPINSHNRKYRIDYIAQEWKQGQYKSYKYKVTNVLGLYYQITIEPNPGRKT